MLPYLRNNQKFKNAKKIGETILSKVHNTKKNSTLKATLEYIGMIIALSDKCLEKALDNDRTLYGEIHEYIARINSNLGNAYHTLRDFEQAKEYLNWAKKISLELFGEKDRRTAMIYTNLASLHRC